MKKTIYHGSSNIIKTPIFGYGKRYNDYGLGFYCTENIDLAKEWGVSFNQGGYANIYEIELEDLNILDLNNENFCMLHWLTILLENREFDLYSPLSIEAKEYLIEHFHISLENVDVIIGYRADDSYFSYAQDFINGTISYRQLCSAMKLGNLGQQFVLISKKAFSKLRYTNFEIAKASKYYSQKMKRDKTAKSRYFDVEKNRRIRGDIFITNIIDEEINGNDPRLR